MVQTSHHWVLRYGGNPCEESGLMAQAALLRWLVMVYNVLADYEILSQLYGVLFNLLDSLTLR